MTWAVSTARFWYAHGVVEHLLEGAGLHDVAAGARLDLPLEQLGEQLHGQVLLRHLPDFGEEVVREDRDVRLLEAGGGEDVDDLVGRHGAGDDLADREIEVLGAPEPPPADFRSTERTAWKKATSSRMAIASSDGTASAKARDSE